MCTKGLGGSLLADVFIVVRKKAEMERDLIVMRTKEGLARVKASGKKIGRQLGSKNKHRWFEGKEKEIEFLVLSGKSYRKIAKEFNISLSTLSRYLQECGYDNNFKSELKNAIKF